MGFFDNENEQQRIKNLEILEDKRLRFAEQLKKKGFAPAQMILSGTDRGGIVGLSRDAGKLWLVVGPDFGGDGEFALEEVDPAGIRVEEFSVASEGMGGLFGFGKKGQYGVYLYIDRGGTELAVPYVINRNGCKTVKAEKNPLLSTKRRRGNSNPVWDLLPIERRALASVRKQLGDMLGIEV